MTLGQDGCGISASKACHVSSRPPEFALAQTSLLKIPGTALEMASTSEGRSVHVMQSLMRFPVSGIPEVGASYLTLVRQSIQSPLLWTSLVNDG